MSPVLRGGFSFDNNIFFVEVEGKIYQRESPAKLYALLTYAPPRRPSLTDSGVGSKPKPHKDPQPVQFYRAQLLHYGLHDLKTKVAAKKNLLAAFKDGPQGMKILEVPQRILKLEEEMREEWNRMYVEEQMRDAAERLSPSIREQEGATIDGELQLFSDSDVDLWDDEVEENEEEKNKKKPQGWKDALADIPPFVSQTRKRFFALDIGVREKLLDDVLNESWETEYSLRTKMKYMAQFPDGDTFTRYGAGIQSSTSNSRAVSSRSRESTVVDLNGESDRNVKREEESVPATGTKRQRTSPSPGSEPSRKRRNFRRIEIPRFCMGSYQVKIPSLQEKYPTHFEDESRQTLILSASSTGSHLWGRFDFGVIHGFLRSKDPPPKSSRQTVYFTWRGRERGSDIVKFGDKNKGIIEFSEDGENITGVIAGGICEQAHFTGRRRAQSSEVNTWKTEYRLINQFRYNHESGTEWLASTGKGALIERAMDSDTTDDDDEDDFEEAPGLEKDLSLEENSGSKKDCDLRTAPSCRVLPHCDKDDL